MWSYRFAARLSSPIAVGLAVFGLAAVSAAPATAAPTAFVWPVSGEVITAYRNGADPYAAGMHRGLDIAAPLGTTVGAAVRGKVTFSGRAPDGALTVTVRSVDERHLASHLHLASLAVRKHDSVAAGQPIGTVGNSGRPSSSRAHVHLGVRIAASGAYVDPLTLLPSPPRNAVASPASARTVTKPTAAAESVRGSALPSEVVRSRGTSRIDADATNRNTRPAPLSAPVRANIDAKAGASEQRGGGTLTAPGLTETSIEARPERLELKPLQPVAINATANDVTSERRQTARSVRRPRKALELAGLAITGICALVLLWRRRHTAPTFPMAPPSNVTSACERTLPEAATGTRRQPD